MVLTWYKNGISRISGMSVSDFVFRRGKTVIQRRVLVVLILMLAIVGHAFAQSPTGTISGIVLDPTAKAIVGADVTLINDATGVKYPTKSNGDGIYVIPNLPPGTYRLQVEKLGFKTLIKPDIVLNVQDALAINFTLPIGAASETVTVEGGAPLLNTESAVVSTVVDRQFVENLPLNGRSFQTLILLTPGVVMMPASSNSPGQFSVNGQRTDANYFTVDGVSANAGASTAGALYQSAGGATAALSALGGTNSLVSVDAMEEFRIQTSSFAPEFGSTPGGQIAIVTRSGTNQFHGALFDYFRNDVLDANDWFANHNALRKPAERQNDFGGVFGGPIQKDKTFFFFSYEGLRLRQPLTTESLVPDTQARASAVAAIQPFLNAYPLQSAGAPDNTTTGIAQFNASYSNPSSLDAYSIRVDHTFSRKLGGFARYNYAPSETDQRGSGGVLSSTAKILFSTQSITAGLTQSVTANIGNEIRANYTNTRAASSNSLDNFGGAVPLGSPALMFPSGVSASNGLFSFFVSSLSSSYSVGKNITNEQRQVDLIDNLSVTTGNHQLKFGGDYRWLSPFSSPIAYEQEPIFSGITGTGGVVGGIAPTVSIFADQGTAVLSQNWSLYGQDTWKISPRLTLTYGLRWDVNPALRGKSLSVDPFTVIGLSNPATMTLAPAGTPLYKTTWGNVAPRLGVAYRLSQRNGWESVLRGGFGIFYDLGTGALGLFTEGFPFTATKSLSNVSLPLTPQQAVGPVLSATVPTKSPLFVADPDLVLPRVYEWNVAVEQSLGAAQSLSVTYIGSAGRDLLRQDSLFRPNPNFGSIVSVTRNTATSDYEAMQIKFQRRISKGLQALLSYSWAHSIDIASDDGTVTNTPAIIANPNVDRGDSDFDVRHSFNGALTYNIPSPRIGRFGRAILGNWSADSLITAHSALPVNITAANRIIDGTLFAARPNVVPDVPLYLFGAQFPGGQAFNAAAFTAPASGQQGDFGRNVLRGFGTWQADFSLRREFQLSERIGIQFRAEFFNIFNHPNFGNPTATNTLITSPLFGQSTQSLASGLSPGGTGGFNPLYQVGGPRSLQFALKMTF